MGMSDEKSTPVGTAQIPQDNQAITNQAGDDFILDFGEGEVKGNVENSDVEHNLGGIEQEPEEEMVSTDMNLNDINLFNEEDIKHEDIQQNDIKIEDEKEESGNVNDGFNVSLDDNVSQEKDENIVKQDLSLDFDEIIAETNERNDKNIIVDGIENDLEQENIESEEVSDLDYPNEGKKDSNELIVIEQENHLEDKKENAEELHDEGFLLDDNESEDEKVDFDNESASIKSVDIDSEDQKISNKDKTEINGENITYSDDNTIENNDKISPALDEFHDNEENKLLNEGENSDNIIPLSDDLDDDEKNNFFDKIEDNKKSDSEDYLEKTSKNESNENEEETEFLDDENKFSYDFQDDISEDNENKSKIENDMDFGDEKMELEENTESSDFDLTKNEDGIVNEEHLSQPEIGDLLGDSIVDPTEDLNDSIEAEDLEFSREPNLQSDADTSSTVDVDQNEKNANLINNSDNEEKKFTLDYKEETLHDNSSNDSIAGEISNETVELNNKEQLQEKIEIIPEDKINETNLANLVNNTVTTSISAENINEKVQNLESKNTNSLQETTSGIQGQQIKSTLSLDQILDSELTNNPQFIDSSKAVPTNVSENGNTFSSKKLIGVIASIGLFILAGIVAVLAFPLRNNNENSGEDQKNYQIVEEYGIDSGHQAPTQSEYETTGQDVSNPHPGHPTVQQDFPEVETEDEGDTRTEEQELGEPEPYTCEGDECLEEPVDTKEESDNLNIESIESVISYFKLQAEKYYTQGDELQDKKLIRYAAQVISLCESYQEQLDNGEGIDEESFSSFKTKVNSIISKMEEYLGGDNDVQTFTKSNFDEEYNFPGKDEHKKYIYEINS